MPMQLDPELERLLAHAGVKGRKAAEALAADVSATMSAFGADLAAELDGQPFRATHDRLRALWRLADESDPRIALIRGGLKELPAEALAAIEERAQMLWPIVLRKPAPTEVGPGWLANADRSDLLKAACGCVAGCEDPASVLHTDTSQKSSVSRAEPLRAPTP
jgi:hypothetical protein